MKPAVLMPRLFFLHNPRAGGTSIAQMFEAACPADFIAPRIENTPQQYRDLARDYSRFRGYGYYAGHYGYCVFEAVRNGHDLITNFRNPVSRILSLYNYWRNNVSEAALQSRAEADAAVVRAAKTKCFSDFIRGDDPNLRLYIDNAHYRQILDTWYLGRVAGPIGFLRVLRRIVGMKWFYIAGFPALSLSALKRAFPRLEFSKIPKVNESKDRQSEDDVPSEDVIYLVTRNRRDCAIYAFALFLQVWRLGRRVR